MNNYILDNNNKFHQISSKVYNNLVKSEIHKLCIIDVDKKLVIENLFKEYNTIDINDMDDDEQISILFINMTDIELYEYLKIYNKESTEISKYITFLDTMSYYQHSITSNNNKNILNSLLNNSSFYWEQNFTRYNSLNNSFINRKFSNINHAQEIQIFKELLNINNVKDNYMLENIDNQNLHYNKKYFSNEFKNSIHTNKDIINIFTQLPTMHEKYILVCNLLSSRTHCHLVLNNPDLLALQDIQDMFNKYEIIFKYLISYAWISFNMEEYSNNILDDNKCILSSLAVQQLPIYPFTFQDINQNPYSSILLDKNAVKMENNCLSLPMINDYKKYYGFADNNEIEKRIKLFIHGHNSNTVLNCIDWDNSVITGSIIAACVQKCNPLLKIYNNENDKDNITDKEYLDYFKKYYGDSDVDILCKANTNQEFVKIVYDMYTKLLNTRNFEYINCSAIHTSSMIITPHIIKHHLMEIIQYHNDPNLNVNYIKSNLEKFKRFFYTKYYVPWVSECNRNLRDLKYENIYKNYVNPISMSKFNLFYSENVYDIQQENDCEKVVKINNINVAKLNNNIRYKLSFPETSGVKQLEIFKTRNNNFMSTIAKFHLAMVRGYWNGKHIMCMPSCVSSTMIGISTNCKYFSSTKDPIHIINKYRNRGFGVVLNDNEKIHMIYYNSQYFKNNNNNIPNDNKYVDVYNININDKSSIDNVFGVKLLNSNIYSNNINDNTDVKYSLTINECFSQFIEHYKQYNLDWMCLIKSIDDNGNIKCIRKELIELVWNNINNS